jgi:hypothetical protein
MYATTHHPPIVRSQVFRWAGRVCGVTLFVVWAAFVAFEATRPTAETWPVGLYFQAASLAVVFAGYAVGWKQELLGAVLIGIGALAYLAVTVADTKMLPSLAIAWFLTPGVLYLLARHFERTERGPAMV